MVRTAALLTVCGSDGQRRRGTKQIQFFSSSCWHVTVDTAWQGGRPGPDGDHDYALTVTILQHLDQAALARASLSGPAGPRAAII
jgi:hypothetical protein